jgi:hypothetical protein
MASGSRHSLRYIPELVRGTTPATPAFKTLRNTGTTLGLAKEILQSEEMVSDRQIRDVRHGTYQVGGDINFELSYGSQDDFLEAVLMGAWTGNIAKAGVLRHYFTIERYFADIASADKPYHRYTGCEVNSLNLAINANAMITGSFGIIGGNMTTATAIIAGATYPAVSTTSPMDSFTGTLSEGGVPIAVITEISLTLENNIEARYVVGSKASIDPSVGRSNLTGSITAYFENSLLLDKFINETESDIAFDLAGTGTQKYSFSLPRIKYTGGQPDVGGEGPITLSMPFQALYKDTDLSQIVVTRTP